MPKKIEVDEKILYKLAAMHCTNEEMASFFGICTKTLDKHFGHIVKRGKERGKMSLRRYQWVAAKKGSVPMLIWLGKQLLGQREPESEVAPTTIILESRRPAELLHESSVA